MTTVFPPTPHPGHPGIAEQEARIDLLTNVLAETMEEAKAARARQDRVITRLEELHQAFIDHPTSDMQGRHSKDVARPE